MKLPSFLLAMMVAVPASAGTITLSRAQLDAFLAAHPGIVATSVYTFTISDCHITKVCKVTEDQQVITEEKPRDEELTATLEETPAEHRGGMREPVIVTTSLAHEPLVLTTTLTALTHTLMTLFEDCELVTLEWTDEPTSSPVPEPGSIVLVFLGLGMLMYRSWGRR